MRGLGYSGNVLNLWEALSQETPEKTGRFIYLVHLAPEEGKLMEEFKECLLSKHDRYSTKRTTLININNSFVSKIQTCTHVRYTNADCVPVKQS